jgi:hypothetical protein
MLVRLRLPWHAPQQDRAARLGVAAAMSARASTPLAASGRSCSRTGKARWVTPSDQGGILDD